MPGFPDGVAGYELCPMLQEQAADAGAEVRMAELEGLEPAGEGWRLATSDGEVAARAVILATGARLRTLGVPGEERLRGNGVSHCASCDAPLLRDRKVGVVGGGDSALQEALTLADAVGEVIVLHRGDALSAQAAYRERVLAHPKIDVRYGTVVEEILGETPSPACARATGAGDDAGPRARRLFVYVGLEPNSDFVRGLIELDADGRIPTDAAHADRAAGRVRGRHRAPRLAGAGGHLGRRRRRGGQGRAPPPGRRAAGRRNRRRRPRPPEATEAHMAEKLTVHDPRGYPPKVAGKPLAPRLQSLDGKTLYLVDCLFDNSDVFMDQLHAWFAEHLPGVHDQAHPAARELGRRPRDARGDPGRRRRRHLGGRPLKHL